MSIVAATLVDWTTGVGFMLVALGSVTGAVVGWRKGRRGAVFVALLALASPPVGFVIGDALWPAQRNALIGWSGWTHEALAAFRVGIAVGAVLVYVLWRRYAAGGREAPPLR